MQPQHKSDRRLSIAIFVIFAVAFHKYTHEGWRVFLEGLGFRHGIFGSGDWLEPYKTASERAVNSWLAEYLLDADRQVMNRITQNRAHGIFSAGISLDTEGGYTSQIGLGGWILSLIPSVFGLGGNGHTIHFVQPRSCCKRRGIDSNSEHGATQCTQINCDRGWICIASALGSRYRIDTESRCRIACTAGFMGVSLAPPRQRFKVAARSSDHCIVGTGLCLGIRLGDHCSRNGRCRLCLLGNQQWLDIPPIHFGRRHCHCVHRWCTDADHRTSFCAAMEPFRQSNCSVVHHYLPVIQASGCGFTVCN